MDNTNETAEPSGASGGYATPAAAGENKRRRSLTSISGRRQMKSGTLSCASCWIRWRDGRHNGRDLRLVRSIAWFC